MKRLPKSYTSAKIAQLYRQGLSTSAIAERFGCGENTVRYALHQEGVTLDLSRRRYDGHGGVTRSNNCLRVGMHTRG